MKTHNMHMPDIDRPMSASLNMTDRSRAGLVSGVKMHHYIT